MNATQISPEARALRIEYNKAWRRRNKDKIRKYNITYWESRLKKQQRQLSLFDTPDVSTTKQRTADDLSILMPRS